MKRIVLFSSGNSNACNIVLQRMRGFGISFSCCSTASDDYDSLMAFCKSHGLFVKDVPVVALYVSDKPARIWSGVFDVNELLELL